MYRVLKNTSRKEVNTIFNGRLVKILSKGSITFKGHDANKKAEYFLQTYGFLKDITDEIKKEVC